MAHLSARFFAKLEKKLDSSGSSKRFIQELKDHSEDKKKDSKDQEFGSFSNDPGLYLGHPDKLARLYKRNFFSERIRYVLALGIFSFVFLTIEIMALDFSHPAYFMEIFSTIGFIFLVFAMPVMYINIFFGALSVFFLGFDINTTPFMRFFWNPTLIASFYTFLFIVFFCKPLWGKRKANLLIH